MTYMQDVIDDSLYGLDYVDVTRFVGTGTISKWIEDLQDDIFGNQLDSKIYAWLAEYPGDVEDVISTHGWDGVGQSLVVATRIAQDDTVYTEVMNNLPEIIEAYAANRVLSIHHIDELDDDYWEFVVDRIGQPDASMSWAFIDTIIDESVQEGCEGAYLFGVPADDIFA